ncbi:hypothetical protein GCM10010252_21130 [Streptomyces aureoverticillatus]|nr:hypothetical protein GCM10010252_21130 [Streptomyces aureoverticillatus]
MQYHVSAERTVTSTTGRPEQDERHRTGRLVVAPRGAPGGRVGPRGGRPARRRRLALALVAADALAAVTAVLLLPGPYRSPVLMALLLAAVLALHVQGRLYEDSLAPALLDELPALCGRITLAWCVTAVLAPAVSPALAPAAPPLTPLPPATLLTAAALHGVLGAGGRALVHWHRRAAVRRRPRPVLVLGHGAQARSVAAALLRRPRCGLRPVGVVGEPADDEPERGGGGGGASAGAGERRVGDDEVEEWAGVGAEAEAQGAACAGHGQLEAARSEHGVATTGTERPAATGTEHGVATGTGRPEATGTEHGVTTGTERPAAVGTEQRTGSGEQLPGATAELPFLSSDDELQRAVIQNDVQVVLLLAGRGAAHDDRLAVLRGLGCELWEIDPRGPAAVPAPRDRGRPLYVAGFRCQPLVTEPLSRRTSAGKRALDVAVSGALLLLAAPLLLTCALVLRVTEGPGVVFRQERVGKDGRLFTVLKFRTHRPADSQESATRWSVADEDRISPFCRFLRSTSLDELPQLWNVLRGDMSLVGPRPERPFFVDRFSRRYPHYAQRHRVLTGVTGLAQIHGLRGDTSIEDRCRFDNAYIDSWSLWQDLCILLRTVGCLLRRTGS